MNLDYLRELYENGYFSIEEEFDDWHDAIKAAIKPLVRSGAAEETYADKIFDSLKENGFYICICPEVCMPHAMNFGDVHRSEISFMKVNKPVVFDNEDFHQSRLFFTLCANSADDHLKNIQKLMALLDQEGAIEAMVACETEEDFKKLLYKD